VNLSIALPTTASLKLEGVWNYVQMPDRHPAGTTIPPYYERVELVTGGHGWIRDEEEWREVLPGDLIWNKPNDSTIGRSDFKNPYRCLAITIVSRKRRGLGIPRFSHWPETEGVHQFVEEAIRLFNDETFERHELLEYVLAQLLFRVRLHHFRRREDELPLPLRRVVDQMEHHFLENCAIDDLARLAQWSSAHLHEVFRERLGTTPHQWLIRRRLRAARERLESSFQPVKQIAVECGFADTAAFTHSFKSAQGLTPTQYRSRYLRLVTTEAAD